MKYTNEELLEIFSKTAKTQSYKLSDSTIKNYLYYINTLIKYLDGKSILDITMDDITSYTLDLECSDSYFNTNLSSFRTLYDILMYHPKTKYLIKVNPTVGVKGVKKVKNKNEQIVLVSEQQESLIEKSKNSRDRAILKLYLTTGLRVHELIALTLTQYNNRSENNEIVLTTTKGSHDRSIWLSDDVIEAIDEYLLHRKDSDVDNLFISNWGNKMDRSCIGRTIKTIAKRTEIFNEDEVRLIANHTMRRSISSTLVNEKNIPIDVIAEFLGHSNLASVKRYAKTSNDRVRMAMVG